MAAWEGVVEASLVMLALVEAAVVLLGLVEAAGWAGPVEAAGWAGPVEAAVDFLPLVDVAGWE